MIEHHAPSHLSVHDARQAHAPAAQPTSGSHAASRAVDVQAIRTPGLGDTTYILSHAGVGIVVDPQRDVDRFLDAGSAEGIRIRYVLETHLHNDYVAGGRELARRAQAELVLPAGAGVGFDHTPAFHLEDLAHDGLVVRPIHTPGHTPEHLSYLILFPTHGQGSFCSASNAGRRTSTIGIEKRTNPLLQHATAEDFATAQLAGLQPYPKYYAFMGGINTLGPQPLPRRTIRELSPEELHEQLDEVVVVDARPRSAVASAHIPGSLGVELADDFGTWVGWLTPFDAPIALVLDPEQDLDEAVVQLHRIGFDRIRGVLRGIQSWQTAGFSTDSYAQVSANRFAAAVSDGTARQVLDVRSPAEWQTGSVPGAQWRYVPDLLDGAPPAFNRSEPVWLACASGFRASIAASLLQRLGYEPVVLAHGGIANLVTAG